MKKIFSYLVVVAVAVALGLLPGSAQAGTLANGAAPAGATFANEIFGPGSDATIVPSGENATAVYTMVSAPGAGAAFMITFTLNQGATWGTALTAGSLVYGPVVTGAVTRALTNGGGADDSTAEFRVDVSATMAANDTFTLTYGIDDADALATAGAAINLAITLTDGLGNVDSAENVDICDSADGTTETVAAAVAGVQIDVATSSVNFTGTSATEVILGSVTLTDGVAVEDDGLTGWDVNTSADAGATVTLTVTGDFSASLGVDTDNDATTADGVYLDIDGDALYTAGEEADTLTATTATWDLGAATAFAATNVHMVVDGTTAIVEQTPSAILTVDWTTATYEDDSVTGNLLQLTKNGSTRDVYNIPGSTISDQAYIRIYNTSPIDGTVRGTLYDQSGLLGTAVLVSDMAAGTTQVFSATDLETLFGTTWTGRARMTVDGEIPSMEVQALIRSATGTITNMSPMAP